MTFKTDYIRSGIDNKQRLKWFESALSDIEKFRNEGELTASDHKELKRHINYATEKAWDRLINEPYFWAGKYENVPMEIRPIRDLNIGTHLASRSLTKARKFPNHPLTRDVIRFLEELAPIGDAVNDLKDKIVKKKRARVEQERQEQQQQSSYVESKDVRKVRQVLAKATQEVKDEFYNDTVKWLNDIILRWKKQYDPENRQTTPREYYKHNPYNAHIVEKVTERQGYKATDPYLLKKGYKSLVEQEARKVTEEVVDEFIAKNTAKLAEIVTKKANLEEVEVVRTDFGRGRMEGTLRLVFKDGSRFTVDSNVVMAFSSRGIPFYRYPTTFHHVHLPDGTKLRGKVSEQRMKNEFVPS